MGWNSLSTSGTTWSSPDILLEVEECKYSAKKAAVEIRRSEHWACIGILRPGASGPKMAKSTK